MPSDLERILQPLVRRLERLETQESLAVSSNQFLELRLAIAQSIANAVFTLISWDTEVIDTDNMWAIGSPTQINIVTAGDWLLTAQAVFAPNATGGRQVSIHKNGSTTALAASAAGAAGAVLGSAVEAHWDGPLIVGDIITIQCGQDSGAPLNLVPFVAGLTYYPSFTATLIR